MFAGPTGPMAEEFEQRVRELLVALAVNAIPSGTQALRSGGCETVQRPGAQLGEAGNAGR